jgi:DNA modification methylase
MARTRIVFETSDEKKSALMEAASLQGATLADWFDEQVASAIFQPLAIPRDEIKQRRLTPDDLNRSHEVLRRLEERDWSFTKDDTRYLTHDLHPYPAKFIPQIPAHLITELSLPGDVVFDPFGGSATTAVEAVRLGRRAISCDANPLSALIGRVKTGFTDAATHTDLEQLSAAIESYLLSPGSGTASWYASLHEKYQEHVPDIPNLEKWFGPRVVAEFSLIRHLIKNTTNGVAHDAAQLALSRIVIRLSNQDSETRYVSVDKLIDTKFALRAYLDSLKAVSKRLEIAANNLQYADARFIVGDSRTDLDNKICDNSIDLIVTSPPYPNATDYHLYHRFRLFWLGFDPRQFGRVEIGSHLRHQRNRSGFEEYKEDMRKVIEGCHRVLSPGRYAVFVVGDAIFKGEMFSTSDAIATAATAAGFELSGMIERPVHETKRSFAKPGRRARTEHLVVLRKPNHPVTVRLNPPRYRMWPYEATLRIREIEQLAEASIDTSQASQKVDVQLAQPALWGVRQLTFTQDYTVGSQKGDLIPTWQKVLENGDADAAKRKDPKYVTHGIHPFKGKFYPQLAKSLLNISGAPVGATLLDPYCGSGTTLLEGMLNGYSSYGCDFNPLAAKIARAKTSILNLPRNLVELSIRAMLDRLSHWRGVPSPSLDHFERAACEELLNWFPELVLYKLNWLLGNIRVLGDSMLVDFFEVILSSFIREVSYQDPTDLRIRRRKEPLEDAPVFDMFKARLEEQHHRLKKYWSVAGRQPGALISPTIIQGDSRRAETMTVLGLQADSVDCVLTSPPYATALPYIDTDRLSLLAIMGLTASERVGYEFGMTGSREIRRRERQVTEDELLAETAMEKLPEPVVRAIRAIYQANKSADVGFRRANMAALLWRYFTDMSANFHQVNRIMKSGAKAFYVVGDSRTKAGDKWVQIETCCNLRHIGVMAGLEHVEDIEIDVTTENYKHIKNAITENKVIIFRKP